LEPPLYVVSSWVIRVYTILITNTISRSSNLDNCFYHCLILILILHLKVLFNLFFFFFFFFLLLLLLLLLLFLLLLLLFIIYIVNLPVVRPRSCRVIYYFDTPALGRRHQSFGHDSNMFWVSSRWSSFTSWLSNFRSFRLYMFLFFML
jgi:hypothetical protein